MSRDDSILSTGSSSASFGTVQEQKVRVEKREEKIEKRAALLPSGEVVRAELQKDIDELSNINFAHVKELVASGIPNALEIDMLSTDKTIAKLKSIQARLDNILRSHDA